MSKSYEPPLPGSRCHAATGARIVPWRQPGNWLINPLIASTGCPPMLSERIGESNRIVMPTAVDPVVTRVGETRQPNHSGSGLASGSRLGAELESASRWRLG